MGVEEAVGGAAADADAMDVKTPMAAGAGGVDVVVSWAATRISEVTIRWAAEGFASSPRPALGSTSLSNKGQCWLPASET